MYKLELKSSHEVIETVNVADVESIFYCKPTDPNILTVLMTNGRRLYCDEVCPADPCEENELNQLWMQELTERNKFWNDFMEYITENAVGDKLSLIQTVHDNEHNWSEGYVKVKKRINERQELLLDFTTSKGDKRTATWQPSDNYACWQTCGMMGDDYSGFLLMPTYKNDEYFCIYYQC